MSICDGYIRVSQVKGREGERFISPTSQREAIEGWAKAHGHTMGRVFEELDESGGRADRPLLLEALTRQESGVAQVLVVAKLDRFGRSLVDGLAAIERVTEAGGAFVSVADELDFSTPTGRLVLRLMLSLGEWELDRVRANWADAQARAIGRGVFLGSVPLGYRRTRTGRLAVDPVTAPIVRQLFDRRMAGATPTQLAGWLTDQAVTTPTGGRRWSYGTVKSLIGRRAYLGESTHGSAHNPAAHSALIDPATWQAAQLLPGRGPGPRSAQPALLRGLVRCASCGRPMTTLLNEHQQLTYACQPHTVAGSCPRRAVILASRVEPYAEATMLGQLRGQAAGRAQAAVRRADVEVAKAEKALADYRDHPTLLNTLGASKFDAGLGVRRERERQAQLQLAGARAQANLLRPGVAQVRRRWPKLNLATKRELIAAHLDCLMISPGHGSDRVWAIPNGQQPPGLPPAAPRATDRLVRWSPEAEQARALPALNSLDWSEAKVARRLRDLLQDYETFPPFSEFQQAGEALLHANAQRIAPLRDWAKRLGVRPPASATHPSGWTEEQVRDQLSETLAGWDRWPTRREFADMGHVELRVAVQFHRGAAYWAGHMGLRMSRHRPPRTHWTLETMEKAVADLAGSQAHWPTRKQFAAAGLSGLYTQLLRSGQREQMAQRLGLGFGRGAALRQPTRWTEEAIAAALDRFLDNQHAYPPYPAWKAAGLGGLHQKLSRRPGGHETFARRYDLARSTAGRPAAT